jgi:hypothetical protein
MVIVHGKNSMDKNSENVVTKNVDQFDSKAMVYFAFRVKDYVVLFTYRGPAKESLLGLV